MFNIGGPEVLVIALVALVIVGPEQLPSVLRKAGQYAAQLRSMSTSLRDEFMSGVDELDPTKWDKDSGKAAATPVLPKGYAERVAAGEPSNPFNPKPVSQKMATPTPEEEAAEAAAAAAKAEAAANRAEVKAKAAADHAEAMQKRAEEASWPRAELEAVEELPELPSNADSA